MNYDLEERRKALAVEKEDYYKNPVRCRCGCGEIVAFLSWKRGATLHHRNCMHSIRRMESAVVTP